jgi:phosphoribosyl 1,2-cyclic phosphate phosphodiesterase
MSGTNDDIIRVTFLGTGTSIGVPVITCDCPVCLSEDPRDQRLRTSVLIETKGCTFVVDCGPDFRIQMLRERVRNLDAVLFTHEHRDHIAGLDDVRAFNYVLNKKIDIYGTKQVMEMIRTEFPYIFSDSRYFGAPQLTVHHTTDQPFSIRGVEFIPIRVMHEKLPVTGFRVGDFTYITDASYISEEEKKKVNGSRIIVLNALRNSTHVSHFSVGEAVEILQQWKPEAAFLTHLSHFVGLHEEVNSKLPDFVQLAYDGLVLNI